MIKLKLSVAMLLEIVHFSVRVLLVTLPLASYTLLTMFPSGSVAVNWRFAPSLAARVVLLLNMQCTAV